MVKHIRNFLNGVAFGITETVPGVSGGTIAIILGFYYELIECVNHFTKDYKKYLKFAIPLILGMVTGLVVFSSIIHFLLTHHSLPTMLFFIGLIVGIIPLIYDKVRQPNEYLPSMWYLVLIPLIFLIIISNIRGVLVPDPAEVVRTINTPFMLLIFVSGIVAAAALVIPGISGSFVLLLIGIYPLATYSISSLRGWLMDITNVSLFIDICKVLVPLGFGVIIGGLSMARLIEKLLLHYHMIIYSIILGLLLGSVYALFRDPIVYQSGTSTAAIVTGAATFICGAIISFNLGKRKL